jgi:hypothetical protein
LENTAHDRNYLLHHFVEGLCLAVHTPSFGDNIRNLRRTKPSEPPNFLSENAPEQAAE